MTSDKALNILLFTNKDSDNLGDKVIEICDIALIQTVMKNLSVEEYTISSYDAEIIFQKKAEELIQRSDILLLGGGPLFNYAYQNFYRRTIITINLAEKYNKPVIFSAVGIDAYSEKNERCQQLKKAVNSPIVKQITTRDGYEFLKQYKTNDQLSIDLVADPAVWSDIVFENYRESNKSARKTIGIYVIRADGFTANGIDFPCENLTTLCKELSLEIESRGYDYEFVSSGHFTDEAFIDYLIRNHGIHADHCKFDINTPEKLINNISKCDGIISCRLHPSIISFSLNTPSVGIIWNSKIEGFYNSIGYGDRAISTEGINAERVADGIFNAIEEGVNTEEDYRMSVYNSLFHGIRKALEIKEDQVTVYSYPEVCELISRFTGTTEKDKDDYLTRKSRRTYKKYNSLIARYRIMYNSGTKAEGHTCHFDETKGKIKKLDTGSTEYWVNKWSENNGRTKLLQNGFINPGHTFQGWRMRIKKADGKWAWYLEDDTFAVVDDGNLSGQKKILSETDMIPYIPFNNVESIVLEAVWKRKVFSWG